MNKMYILDTSVLLNSGKSALYSFGDNEVIIPLGVVKELESTLKDNEFGWIARGVLRELESLTSGVRDEEARGLENGGSLKIELNHVKRDHQVPNSPKETSNTVTVAKNLKTEFEPHGKEVILITNDLTQRLIARHFDIKTSPYKRASSQGEYSGVSEISLDDDQVDKLYSKEKQVRENDLAGKLEDDPVWHSYVVGKHGAESSGALAVKDSQGNLKNALSLIPSNPSVKARSAEQRIAQSHLFNPDVDVVSLGGAAGTGKTLLALGAGMDLLNDKASKIKKVVVFRPLEEVGGQKLGFLPGTEEEKMEPWTEAVKDALSVFMSPVEISQAFLSHKIEVHSTAHIRGRTINNALIIIDEAQNFERLTLLSILSRLGENSKAVLSWDAAQRDNIYISKDDGITAVVDIMKNEPLFAHITLTKSERSRAAEMATRILDELTY